MLPNGCLGRDARGYYYYCDALTTLWVCIPVAADWHEIRLRHLAAGVDAVFSDFVRDFHKTIMVSLLQ